MTPNPQPPQPLQRLPDADARLQRLLASRLAVPFGWGTADCALLVADAARAVTGVDPVPDLRGRYRSAAGALRVVSRALGLPQPGSMAQLMAAMCQQRLGGAIEAAQAMPGDAGLCNYEGQQLLAVCAGGGQWLAPAERGLLPVPAPAQAWRVAACLN